MWARPAPFREVFKPTAPVRISSIVEANEAGPHPPAVCGPGVETRRQAQLDPTALSVLAMLLPADWTFCPWELACS